MPRRFAALGECMIEIAPSPESGRFSLNFAGDTFNTAWYARRLLPKGWEVDYVTAVGTDSASRQMLEFMAASDIGTGHIRRDPNRTVGLYLIELDGAERHFSYWRGQSAARGLADDFTTLTQALSGAELVYFSGITLGILSTDARKTLLDAMATARSGGATIAFDPNLRPRLWASSSEMCDAVTQAAAISDIVLPSFEDEAVHFGDADPAATASRYGGQGAGLVVVKNGPGEILTLSQGKRAIHQPVRVTDPVDTTAAGDSFNAGFLAAWLQDPVMPLAIAAGSGIAAQVIRSRGALVPVEMDDPA